MVHVWVAADHGFDFAKLDAEPAQFDLPVEAAHELQRAVAQAAHPIARAVEPIAWRPTERIGDEAFGRQRRLIQIPSCQAVSTQIQLPSHADRNLVQVRVQHVRPGIGDGRADGHRRHVSRQRLRNGIATRKRGALGRAVTVDDPGRGQPVECPAHVRHRECFAADEQLPDAHEQLRTIVHHRVEERGREPQAVNTLSPQRLGQRIQPGMPVRLDDQSLAVEQRAPDFEGGGVKRDRCQVEHRLHVIPVHEGGTAHQTHDPTIGNRDTLRPPG